MKKLKILSFATILFLVGCTTNKVSEDIQDSREEISEVVSNEDNSSGPGVISATPDSKANSSSSNGSSYTPREGDYSQQSTNCKAYLDAMRAQHNTMEDDYRYIASNVINKSTSVDIKNWYDTATWEHRELKSDRSWGVDVKIPDSIWNRNSVTEIDVQFGLKQDFSDATTIRVDRSTVQFINLQNLFSAKTYYWRMKGSEDQNYGESNTFTTGDYPRWISCGGMYNVRDNGGYMTHYGKRIKQGLVFRGGEITHKAWATDHTFTGDAAAKEVFRNTMKIGVELDLRRTADLGGGETYTSCMFAENGDIDWVNKSINSYGNGVNNDYRLIKDIFDLFANADKKPVYYHCHGGADRTGIIGWLLNGLLGVSYTDLCIDFELTSYSSIGGGDCKRSHLYKTGRYDDYAGFLSAMRNMTVNGTKIWDDSKLISENVEAYLTKKAGVASSTITKIRQIMLED